jgi:hypothetical protein
MLHNNKNLLNTNKHFQPLPAQSRQKHFSNSYIPSPNEIPEQTQTELQTVPQTQNMSKTAKELSGLQLGTTYPTLACARMHAHTHKLV